MIPVPSYVLLVTILVIWRKISKFNNMDRNRTVAGLDVHKDSIYLCIMGHDEAIIFEKTYGVLTPDLRQMCQDMLDRGVTEAAMESTAVYWVPVWNELCDSMELKLVNPYFIKQLPGRKSDVKDAQWIAECLLKNLIRGSFVPEPIVQDMRKLNRRIFDLQEDITYYTNKLDAALHRCGFRLSNYVCRITGKVTARPLPQLQRGGQIRKQSLNVSTVVSSTSMDGIHCLPPSPPRSQKQT